MSLCDHDATAHTLHYRCSQRVTRLNILKQAASSATWLYHVVKYSYYPLHFCSYPFIILTCSKLSQTLFLNFRRSNFPLHDNINWYFFITRHNACELFFYNFIKYLIYAFLKLVLVDVTYDYSQ